MARSYRYKKPVAVTPADDPAALNIEGAWSIFVTVSGNVNFYIRGGTTVTIPVFAGSGFELGLDMVHIKATLTTATGIFKCV